MRYWILSWPNHQIYRDFKTGYASKEADHETYLKAFAKQQETIKKTEAFIRKFKAGTRATMAKSREKQLARMDK